MIPRDFYQLYKSFGFKKECFSLSKWNLNWILSVSHQRFSDHRLSTHCNGGITYFRLDFWIHPIVCWYGQSLSWGFRKSCHWISMGRWKEPRGPLSRVAWAIFKSFFSSLWWLLIFFFEIVIDDTHALLLMSLARCSFVPSRKLLNKKFNHWANYLVFISTISLMVSSLFIALFRNVFRVFALFSSVDPSIFVNYTRTWSVTPILYILLFKLFIFRRRFSCLLLQTFFTIRSLDSFVVVVDVWVRWMCKITLIRRNYERIICEFL